MGVYVGDKRYAPYVGSTRRKVAEKALPYDAEIEYLEATGGQWIDVLQSPTSTSVITIDGDFTYPANGTCAFSANTGWSFNQYTLFKSSGNYYWGISQASFSLESKRQTFKIDGISFYADDVLKKTGTWKDAYVNTTLKIFSHGDTTLNKKTKGKLYGVTFKNNNTTILNMIPVRVGQVGFMYDRVSKTLFGNAGTGDFILGNDIKEVEYLESTGTQYIDTGILIDGTGTFSFEVKTTLTDRSSSGAIIGTRESSSGYTRYKSYNIFNLSTTRIRADLLGKRIAGEGTIDTTANTLIIKFDTSTQSLTVNGVNIAASSTNQSCSYPFYLFSVNNGNAANIPQRLEYFKFAKNGNTIMHLIPVRVGTVGYMYDKVSKTLFGNAGTGNFILGNDV